MRACTPTRSGRCGRRQASRGQPERTAPPEWGGLAPREVFTKERRFYAGASHSFDAARGLGRGRRGGVWKEASSCMDLSSHKSQ